MIESFGETIPEVKIDFEQLIWITQHKGLIIMGKFISTKRFGPISTCHRNFVAEYNKNRDSRKCALIHGYSRYVQLTFSGEVDEHQWVQDFGDCKFIKELLDEAWDHKVLISSLDPRLDELQSLHDTNLIHMTVMDASKGWGPGIEGSGKWLYDNVQPILTEKTEGRVQITKVEIWEHENNSAAYIPDTE